MLEHDGERMTNEEAEAMLAQLSNHYGEPVMPIGRYCAGMTRWQCALRDRYYRAFETLYPGGKSDHETAKRAAAEMRAARAADFRDHTDRDYEVRELTRLGDEADDVDRVFTMIQKSDLLARLLYGGEQLRTRMCPEHEGRWSGVDWHGHGCKHGCGLTGWLPEYGEDAPFLGEGI